MIPIDAAERLQMRLENQRALIHTADLGARKDEETGEGIEVELTKGGLSVKLFSWSEI